MPKRGNENAQLRKEEYEAQERSDSAVGDDGNPLGAGGFSRAGDGVMRQRRIVKVASRHRKPGAGGAGGAMPSASAPPAASSNPFGSIKLNAAPAAAAAAAAAANANANANASNPFASVQLPAPTAAPSVQRLPTVPPAGGFSFGTSSSIPKAHPKPVAQKALGGFSFDRPTNAVAAAADASTATASTAPAIRQKKADAAKMRDDEMLSARFFDTIRRSVNSDPASDMTATMQEYLDEAEVLAQELGDVPVEEDEETDTVMGGMTPAKPSVAPVAAPAPAAPAPAPAAAPAFSFATSSTSAPAPAPAASKPFSGFSFATAPAAAAPAAAASTSFSFGANPTAAPAPPPAATTAVSVEDGDAFAKEDPSKVEREKNDDEEILLEKRAKYLKNENGIWKSYLTGALRLLRHKETKKCRMVMRDSVGKVQLNLGVAPGMPFVLNPPNDKGTTRTISFMAKQHEDKGVEHFNLMAKIPDAQAIHDTLKLMSEE